MRGDFFMEPVYGQILQKGYGLRLMRAVRSRTGIVCSTDRGMRELKKYAGDDLRLAFDWAVRERLFESGFGQVLRYHITVDGEQAFCWNDQRYVLEDYAPPMPEDGIHVYREAALGTLAAMHLVAKGLTLPSPQSSLGRLPETFAKRRRELVRCRNWVKSCGGTSAVDRMLLKSWKDYQDRIDQAERLLMGSGYGEQCAEAERLGAFCHNAYKTDNLRLGSGGRLYVTGFDKAGYDLWVTDLADTLRRQLRRGLDCNSLARLLDAYQQVRPLSHGEKQVLMALLIYPQRYLKLVNAYYNKRRVCVSQAEVARLRECLDSWSREDEVLSGLWKTLF